MTGRIVALHGEPGQMAPVGSPLVELEVEGAGNVKGNGHIAPASAPKKAEAPKAAPAPKPEKETARPAAVVHETARPSFAARPEGDKPLASPAVRQRALDRGVDLRLVAGTGRADASRMRISTTTLPRAAAS